MTDTALYLIATPIGDDGDLSPRATRLLLDAELVIGEEFRPLTTLVEANRSSEKASAENNQADPELRSFKRTLETGRRSGASPIESRKIARDGRFVALMSDCGTPGFCDPGAPLVHELRKRGLKSSSAPGASSLMCLLSLSGQQLTEFVFRGFLPNDREEREKSLRLLAQEDRPVVLMDTPYRLEKLLGELSRAFPARHATLGCDFTSPQELVISGTLQSLAKTWSERPADNRKAEFMILLHAANEPSQNSRRVDEPRPNVQGRVHANEKQPFARKKQK
jgi:16S rRNA (cytidine1402-2'-O)-methyltransferase